MATQLDLQEQEQLENIKHFWKQYGNLITWVVILVLGAFAAWNGWNWWQRDQAYKASALYDEVEKAAQAGNAEQAQRAFDDLKDRHPRTVYASQAALLAAKALHDQGKADAARAALAWVIDKGSEAPYRAIARLRLAGLLLDAKAYDEALKQLDADLPGEFAKASIVAVTSRAETPGMTVIEALGCGVPVLGFDSPRGPGEFVTSGRDGVLVPEGPGEIEAYASALLALIDDERRRHALAAGALETAAGHAASVVAARWERVLADLRP